MPKNIVLVNLFIFVIVSLKCISSLTLKSNYYSGLNLIGFDEIIFVTDSVLRQEKDEIEGKSNEIAVWRLREESHEQLYGLDGKSKYLLTETGMNLLLVCAPQNISSLNHHMKMIAEFYQRSNQRSATTPFFLIVMPNDTLNQNAPEIELNFTAMTLTREFLLDSNVFVAYDVTTWSKRGIRLPKIKELYSLLNNPIFEEIFSRESLFYQILSKAARRANLRKHVISCTAQNDPDYHLESEFNYVDETWKMVGGLSVEILRDLETALNFTSQIVPGQGWVDKSPNGSWIGMGRQVFEMEVDISFSQSIFMLERSAAFTFLHPTHAGSVAAFFKQPRSSYFRNIYKHAFDSGLWLISISFWLIAAVVIVVIYKITLLSSGGISAPADEELSRNSLLWAIGTPCQQGWYQDPKSRSLKIVFMSGSICALISYIGFSGGLVSILSTEVEPIQTVSDLLTSPLKLLTDAFVPFIDDILEHAIDSLEQPIEPSRLNKLRTSVTAEIAVKEILTKPSAFLTLPDGFMTVFRRNFTDAQFCESLSSIRVAGKPHPTGMFMRKGSPYKEIFNQKIIVTFERGLNFRSRKRYVFGTTAHCSYTRVNYRGGLDLRDVYSAFAVLLGGFCICTAVGIIEYMGHRFRVFRGSRYFTGPVPFIN